MVFIIQTQRPGRIFVNYLLDDGTNRVATFNTKTKAVVMARQIKRFFKPGGKKVKTRILEKKMKDVI